MCLVKIHQNLPTVSILYNYWHYQTSFDWQAHLIIMQCPVWQNVLHCKPYYAVNAILLHGCGSLTEVPNIISHNINSNVAAVTARMTSCFRLLLPCMHTHECILTFIYIPVHNQHKAAPHIHIYDQLAKWWWILILYRIIYNFIVMKQPYILECTLETEIFQDDRDVNAICILYTDSTLHKQDGR